MFGLAGLSWTEQLLDSSKKSTATIVMMEALWGSKKSIWLCVWCWLLRHLDSVWHFALQNSRIFSFPCLGHQWHIDVSYSWFLPPSFFHFSPGLPASLRSIAVCEQKKHSCLCVCSLGCLCFRFVLSLCCLCCLLTKDSSPLIQHTRCCDLMSKLKIFLWPSVSPEIRYGVRVKFFQDWQSWFCTRVVGIVSRSLSFL